mmetsp:Transcript_24929/g.56254  ORF Transcript_24929/g.56254 Transcript_24929/m.56254 type:complete len:281 (-) Transcript_24929:211-1053(-)
MSTFPGKLTERGAKGGTRSNSTLIHLSEWFREAPLEQNAKLRKQCLDSILYNRLQQGTPIASEDRFREDFEQSSSTANYAHGSMGNADDVELTKMEETCSDFASDYARVWRPMDETKTYPRGFCEKTPTKLNTSTSPIYQIPDNICHSKNSSIMQGLYNFEKALESTQEQQTMKSSSCFEGDEQSQIEWITSTGMELFHAERSLDLHLEEAHVATKGTHHSSAPMDRMKCISLCHSLLHEISSIRASLSSELEKFSVCLDSRVEEKLNRKVISHHTFPFH